MTEPIKLPPLPESWETELLDWVSACQSAYHIENTPNHRFGGLGSNLEENRSEIICFVRGLIESHAATAVEADRQARGGDQTEQKPPETRINTGLEGGDQRAAFEAWISSPPRNHKISRSGERAMYPGRYEYYEAQIAWDAWQEALKSQPRQPEISRALMDERDALRQALTEVLRVNEIDADNDVEAWASAMLNARAALAGPQPAASVEPVAVVGADFALLWAGSGPIAPLVERHGLKAGSHLYAAPVAAQPSAQAQQDAEDAKRYRTLVATGHFVPAPRHYFSIWGLRTTEGNATKAELDAAIDHARRVEGDGE